MELLENPEDRGYPTDYFLSRIKGRRAQLIRDWRPFVYGASPLESLSSPRYRGFVNVQTPDDIWKYLVREYRWAYIQMNGALRKVFAPFFLYTELRTICICLRQMKEKSAGRTGELLETSLLAEGVKKVLATGEDPAVGVAGIEHIFQSLSPEFGGLKELLDAEGLRGVEQRLTNTYLVYLMSTNLNPIMREFFSRIIDSRNIISLFKYQHLNSAVLPVFLPGGSIPVARLEEIVRKDDLVAVGALVRERTGIKVDQPNPTVIETSLYRGITRYLRQTGKDAFGVGPIMDYLWRCSIEAMNLGILFYGKDLERDLVTAELVH